MSYRRILFPLVISLLATGCNRLGYQSIKRASGLEGMIVSAHPLATAAGTEILRAGGNATDAAIAVQFALAVVVPRAGNLGGGGFWVHAPASDKVRTLDYREEAPAAATRDMYLDESGDPVEGASTKGALAAGIPGTVDGMWTAYTFGSKLRDWSALLQPAIRLASSGFRVSAEEARRLNLYQDDFGRYATRSPFYKAGTANGDAAWKRGDLLQQPRLAATLSAIADEGPGYFYEGDFARRLAEEVSTRGGIWTAADLSGYQSVWREPIEIDYAGLDIYSMPPPSSGGIVLAQMLGLLDGYDLNSIAQTDSAAYFHLLIEAMRRAYEDRAEYLGDPDLVDIPVDSLLSTPYLLSKWETFSPDTATRSGLSLKPGTKEVYETTHTSVVDGEGNAVSVTTTLNGNYGSKVWSEVGGFFLNNEMDDFSMKPGVPNMFGLVGGDANAIAPGKRMLSSMTPVVAKRGEETVVVVGSPGGSTIITAVMQVLLNLEVHRLSPTRAVAKPRIHHQWLPDEVLYEPGAMSPAVRQALEAKGHTFRQVETLGRVKLVARPEVGEKTYIGVGDERSPDDSAATP